MPVLWQPQVVTDLTVSDAAVIPAFTLNVITTQWIDTGVIFSFQIFDGMQYTYAEAAGSGGANLAEFDLTVRQPIPPGTVLVVSITPTSTALWGYTGVQQYSNIGAGVLLSSFSQYNTCLVFARVPTAAGAGLLPAGGQPQFAIGFNYTSGSDAGSCSYTGTGAAYLTAPNFPDQFSTYTNPWTFDYTVVYPAVVPTQYEPSLVCQDVPGVKFQYGATSTYATGSWGNLRQVIAQPWTVVTQHYNSVSHWGPWTSLTTAGYPVAWNTAADVGPFQWAAEPGHAAVVYFRPRPKDINTNNTALSPTTAWTAQLGIVVLAPIPANTSMYFTVDELNLSGNGFGASGDTGTFINYAPSFQWVVGSADIRPGTVLLFDNIGGGSTPITVTNVHNTTADVGAVVYNIVGSAAVVSIMMLGVWVSAPGAGTSTPLLASQFVTAALSNQYVGDYPPLSPGLTISTTPFTGPLVYSPGKLLSNENLPGVVQNGIINSSPFVLLETEVARAITPATAGRVLPAFAHMS